MARWLGVGEPPDLYRLWYCGRGVAKPIQECLTRASTQTQARSKISWHSTASPIRIRYILSNFTPLRGKCSGLPLHVRGLCPELPSSARSPCSGLSHARGLCPDLPSSARPPCSGLSHARRLRPGHRKATAGPTGEQERSHQFWYFGIPEVRSPQGHSLHHLLYRHQTHRVWIQCARIQSAGIQPVFYASSCRLASRQ